MTGDVFTYPARSGCLFIKSNLNNWTYDLKGLFFRRGMKRTHQNWAYDLKGLYLDLVIKPLCLFCANGGFPATIFWSSGVSANPVQIDSFSDTPMQTASVSATYVQ